MNTAEEEQPLYETIVAPLTEEHNPQGPTEEILVSDIATIRISLNRFDRAEHASSLSGEIKKKSVEQRFNKPNQPKVTYA